jgi:hypothetical protein
MTENNFILQNVYDQVVYVNPFNKEFESELHASFEDRWNAPREISKRLWKSDEKIPNRYYAYFGDCATQWMYCVKNQTPREWKDTTAKEAEKLASSGIQIGLFFTPTQVFEERFDVDEDFTKARIVEVFDNVFFTEPNVWNVIDDKGNIISTMESDKIDLNWKILANAGSIRSERRTYAYDFPIHTFRQFREDMHRLGVRLLWKEGICLNHPNLTWRQRNEPGLSHLVDVVDNGVTLVNKRDERNVLYFGNDGKLVIDHIENTVALSDIPKELQNAKLAKELYSILMSATAFVGTKINQVRDLYGGDTSVQETDVFEDILFQIQRRLKS